MFNQSITNFTSFSVYDNTAVRNLQEGVWYVGLTLNNYSYSARVTTKIFWESETTVLTTQTLYGLAQAFKCSPNQTYMLDCDISNDEASIGCGFFDNTGSLLSWKYVTNKTFTTPENCYWMTICLGGLANTEVTYSNIQLTLGSTATDYEPYGYKIPVTINGTTTNIYLDEPLRKVGDYADYIDIENKKVVRNVANMKVLSVAYEKVDYTNMSYLQIRKPTDGIEYGNQLQSYSQMSESFVSGKYEGGGYDSEQYIDNILVAGNAIYFIGFEYGTSLETMEELLADSYLYYILAEPIEETIDIPAIFEEAVSSYEILTTIQPEVTIEYTLK